VKLVESGEKEKLMELLRERLVECGWRDEMKALCRFELFSHRTQILFVLSVCLLLTNTFVDSYSNKHMHTFASSDAEQAVHIPKVLMFAF
jgi:hypothetical protein